MMLEKGAFLDTCALLYLVSGSDKLSTHAKTLIDNAGVVFVSPITAWEISLKALRGKLSLPMEPEEWFWNSIEHHNVRLYPLEPKILMLANRLPWHHNDPADRFIIASAKETKTILITTDKKFRDYDVEIVQ